MSKKVKAMYVKDMESGFDSKHWGVTSVSRDMLIKCLISMKDGMKEEFIGKEDDRINFRIVLGQECGCSKTFEYLEDIPKKSLKCTCGSGYFIEYKKT